MSVPVKQPSDDGANDGVDNNKFSREFQETLDDYARAYDDWCTAQSVVDDKFSVYKQKQHKFDKLAKEFPSELMTPVDVNYLKKIVRRARQNRHKRIKTAAKHQPDVKEEAESDDEEEEEEEEEVKQEYRKVHIPALGTEYPTMKYEKEKFDNER